MKHDQPISVALVEDEKEIRQGLVFLLNNTDGFRCAGAFRSYEEALEELHDEPDILLSDIGLPGISGIEGVPIFKERYPNMAVVMLTVFSDNERIFQSLCAGASGYILKKTPPARILDALREVQAGGAVMSPEIALKVVAAFRIIPRVKKVDSGLTRREEEILTELVKGNSYKTIADQLFISIHTVRFHIRAIYEKLHVHSKSEAVAKALKNQIV